MNTSKVLVVEDEKDLRDIYEIILKRDGYDVYTSSNGKEALEVVKAQHPTIVLLDIFMPVMDGKSFLQNVHIDDYPDMKIIVCSNTSDNNLMNEMIALGAEKVVTKADLGPKNLASLIRSYTSK
ncbi:MAG: two component transcriptional regulator, winged helix family [Candidatus Saccharibacteria bacterium]|nr:two component transcriptional regulator, winged helix family [Candidatus Saccharibacteria bacterium]